ncbi:hypothetical protein AGMMS50230_20130 [Spirochaetia bacterium]|nr:hypothetical protein AGMMS50230_20130 [Spirochaetia bacterium]
MAFFKAESIKISGISACVPKQIEENALFPLFASEEFKNFATTTGIERKRKVVADICTSDLCISAAEALISSLNWNKDDISILVFVTQTPDYILPATSPIIQHKLGLSKNCYFGYFYWGYGVLFFS